MKTIDEVIASWPPLLRVSSLRRRLREEFDYPVSERTLRNRVREGVLSAVHPGNREWLIETASVSNLLRPTTGAVIGAILSGTPRRD